MRIPVSGQEIWEGCWSGPIETHVTPYMTGIGQFTSLSWQILVKSCIRQHCNTSQLSTLVQLFCGKVSPMAGVGHVENADNLRRTN